MGERFVSFRVRAGLKPAPWGDGRIVASQVYELYNLAEDPNELTDRAGNPAYSSDHDRLKNRLAKMESSLLNNRLYLPTIIKGLGELSLWP